MDKLVPFTKSQLQTLLNTRPGESKFGEHIKCFNHVTDIYEQLKNLDVTYVIFGIPEDVGVFANHGNTGASGAYEATLKILLNIQSNSKTHAEKVLVLGHLDCSSFLKKIEDFNQNVKKDIEKARKLVSKIDKHVSELVFSIVSAGKIPIIIGGGHNNAYGNIKGSSLALKTPINVINFDAHTDYRKEEGRHSGNGFTYAKSEGFLNKYFIFGLHENYTSDTVFKMIDANKTIAYHTFENIIVKKEIKFKQALKDGLLHIDHKPFGIELDCDAIQNIPSSAMSPSGFSVNKARFFVDFFGKQQLATYLHICEATPSSENNPQVGKLITYLITDFIRAHEG